MQPGLDHLVFTVSELEKGIEEAERLLGVRAQKGGQHLQWGTHNALLSLGSGVYLEIVAPDPTLVPPERGIWLAETFGPNLRLITWAYRLQNIESLLFRAENNDLELGLIQKGSRELADGTSLGWRLSDPYAMPLKGAFPFLIDWGDSLHPSVSAPLAGELEELHFNHSESARLRQLLSLLMMSKPDIKIRQANRCIIKAKIKTAKETVLIG